MKNILTFLLFFTTAAVAAASTCETRVDSHQKATTKQRVDYCLTAEPEPVAVSNKPELVYSSTYSQEATEQAPVKTTAKDGYFEEEKISIRRQYVGSQQFPAFKNDLLSEQEQAALEKVYLKELETKRQEGVPAPAEEKLERTQRAPARISATIQGIQMTDVLAEMAVEKQQQSAKDLKNRQQKPKRTMKTTSVSAQETPTQEVAPSTEETSIQGTNSLTTTPSQTQDTQSAGEDPLLSAAYQNDDLLNDELGIGDEIEAKPIPSPSVNK